jgi:hypothetical protein
MLGGHCTHAVHGLLKPFIKAHIDYPWPNCPNVQNALCPKVIVVYKHSTIGAPQPPPGEVRD